MRISPRDKLILPIIFFVAILSGYYFSSSPHYFLPTMFFLCAALILTVAIVLIRDLVLRLLGLGGIDRIVIVVARNDNATVLNAIPGPSGCMPPYKKMGRTENPDELAASIVADLFNQGFHVVTQPIDKMKVKFEWYGDQIFAYEFLLLSDDYGSRRLTSKYITISNNIIELDKSPLATIADIAIDELDKLQAANFCKLRLPISSYARRTSCRKLRFRQNLGTSLFPESV